MITDYFKIGYGNIKQRKLRSALTVLGIFISIATIFVLISLSIGLDGAIKEQFRQLGSDKFFIQPKGQAGGVGSVGAVQLTTSDVDVVKKVSGVKDLSYATAGNAKIEFANEQRYLNVLGVPLDNLGVFIETGFYKIDSGRFLKKGDVGKVVVGNRFATDLYKRPVKVGDSLLINSQEFKVVGILKTIGNRADDGLVAISYDDFKTLFKTGERVDQIIVQVQDGESINKIADSAKRKLMNFRGVKEKTIDFIITTPEELLKSFATILNIITAFLLGVAGISLLVGGIGIANTMYTSVLERTKEIGVMKAIGAKNSDILWIFVIESGMLGIIGGIIGILLGIGIGKVVEFIAVIGLGTNLLRIAIPWYLVAGCLLFAFLIGAFSGFFPARQASKIKPADTLRYE